MNICHILTTALLVACMASCHDGPGDVMSEVKANDAGAAGDAQGKDDYLVVNPGPADGGDCLVVDNMCPRGCTIVHGRWINPETGCRYGDPVVSCGLPDSLAPAANTCFVYEPDGRLLLSNVGAPPDRNPQYPGAWRLCTQMEQAKLANCTMP
jgi:hypothetical protein